MEVGEDLSYSPVRLHPELYYSTNAELEAKTRELSNIINQFY